MNLTMFQAWLLVIGLVLTTALIKAAGPVLVGGRDLSPRMLRVAGLTAPPLLAALIVTSTLADGSRLGLGAETAGVAAAGVLLVRRVPLVMCAAVAVGVTATLRALL